MSPRRCPSPFLRMVAVTRVFYRVKKRRLLTGDLGNVKNAVALGVHCSSVKPKQCFLASLGFKTSDRVTRVTGEIAASQPPAGLRVRDGWCGARNYASELCRRTDFPACIFMTVNWMP
jgi:hypothetical protein